MTNREIAEAAFHEREAPTPMHWATTRDAIIRRFTAALDAKTPPTGHILDDTGTVRKVLGTLPVTADGCVPTGGTLLFHPSESGGYGVCPGIRGNGPVEFVHIDSRITHLIGECYSTRELAEAARAKA